MSYPLILTTVLFVLVAIFHGYRYLITPLWLFLIISAWPLLQLRLALGFIPWYLELSLALSLSLPLFIFSLWFTGLVLLFLKQTGFES